LALKASGTQTYLTWIPSHIGITGNEVADKLASYMDEIPLFNSIRNILTPIEVISLYKKNWSISTLNYLKLCGKPSVTSKTWRLATLASWTGFTTRTDLSTPLYTVSDQDTIG
jgi:hypothetical protein